MVIEKVNTVEGIVVCTKNTGTFQDKPIRTVDKPAMIIVVAEVDVGTAVVVEVDVGDGEVDAGDTPITGLNMAAIMCCGQCWVSYFWHWLSLQRKRWQTLGVSHQMVSSLTNKNRT